jgi:hypothetical protein
MVVARDDDGDGFCEVHVNTMEGFWSLLRSWLRPHQEISQAKLPLCLGFLNSFTRLRREAKPYSVLCWKTSLLHSPESLLS